jgi:hypothetical protein
VPAFFKTLIMNIKNHEPKVARAGWTMFATGTGERRAAILFITISILKNLS